MSRRSYFLLIFFAFMFIYKLLNGSLKEHLKIIDLKKTGFYKCNDYPVGMINKEVLTARGQKKNNKDWHLYFPCGYNDAEEEIKRIDIKDNSQKIFIIDGCDYIVSKFTLWQILKRYYGREQASKILPNSFLSQKKNDMDQFWLFYNNQINKNSLSKFILKKDVQRKEGINIVRSRSDIEKIIKNENYVLQEYLRDPFIIDGHKVNLRYYLLIVCKPNNVKEGYIHLNGVTHYTLDKYDDESLDFYKNITSSYEEREEYEKIYENNPFSVNDFHVYLKNNNYDFEIYMKNLINCLRLMLDATQNYFCNELKNNIKFQLFGCDIAPDKYLNVRLLELNKGPNFIPRNKKDKDVKSKVVNDLLDLIDDQNIIDLEEENDFIKIWNN